MSNGLTLEVKNIALALMEGLSCPRSLTVAILIRYEDWVQIAQLSTDPRNYLCSESYYGARAASDFLRKYVDLPTGIDTEQAAIAKWWQGEHDCKRTNERLNSYLDPLWDNNDKRILDFISKIRENVRLLIGSQPPVTLKGYFGPGATMSDKTRATTVADKMSSVLTMTAKSWVHVRDWMSTAWGLAHADLGLAGLLVRGNAYFTVNKDATTKRSCAKEPSFVAPYQLGAGKAMRKLMFRGGIDLKDGQEKHRKLAREGSFSGTLATIDLTNASDTVCTTLVKLVLPSAWYDLLDSLRSPYTCMPDGKWVRLEKFSSMGNGFTFELETVIFAAIARAACSDDDEWCQVSVYGDDIIAPVSAYEDIIAALGFFGFTPNVKKTFGTGSFRESCGGDFFGGTAVRPYYLKEFNHEPQDYISLANGLRRMAFQGHHDLSRFSCVRRAWFCCLDNLPIGIRRLRGPKDLGDTVIHDTEERWITRSHESIRYVRSYSPIVGLRTRFEGFAYSVQLATALYLAGSGIDRPTRTPEGDLTPRDAVTGYKVGWTAYS